MNLGLVQYNPAWEDKSENQQKIISLLEKVSVNSIDLLLFPEMTLTGFTMNAEKCGEPILGDSFNFFSGLAVKLNTNIIAGLIEKENESYFNSIVHIDRNGNLVKKFRKIHLLGYASEDKHYLRGESPIITEIDDWKTGLSICYDLRFPELYRHYAKSRVELIIVAANWPAERIEHWRLLLRARAIENQCFVMGINRVGNDPKLFYPGYSSAINPMGKEIFSSTDEGIFILDIKKEENDAVRNKLPFLKDIILI